MPPCDQRQWIACSLLLAVLAAGGCRETEADAPARAAPRPAAARASIGDPAGSLRFIEVTEAAGLEFTHEPAFEGEYRFEEIMGPGCALADFNGDDLLDIYLVNGQRERASDRLYLQSADGGFVDATTASGLSPSGYGMGCAVGDYDNDGDLDLYLTNLAADELWRNEGDATFTDVTAAAGLDNRLWSVSAGFFDYDRDGRLDLYVANYVLDPDSARCYDLAGRPDYCGPDRLPPAPDKLYRNLGGGRFRDVSAESGIAAIAGPGLGVLCADLDNDGWQDVYVANDMARNFLWINRGDGSFEETAVLAGCAFNRDGAAEAGMGIALGDVDLDGLQDLLVTHLRGETNTLYRTRGPGAFDDATDASGLGMSSTPYTGFGTVLADFDLDGDLDAFVVNGAVKRRTLISPHAATDEHWTRYAEPNLAYRNDGTGRFENVSATAGVICTRAEVSRGLAAGDYDNDGDLDLLMTHTGGPARLFRNDGPRVGRWLIVRAVEPAARRDAIGAVVSVTAGGRTHRRVVLAADSYASTRQPSVHFGLGDVDRIDDVTVRWPDGSSEQFAGVGLDMVIELRRSMGEP